MLIISKKGRGGIGDDYVVDGDDGVVEALVKWLVKVLRSWSMRALLDASIMR